MANFKTNYNALNQNSTDINGTEQEPRKKLTYLLPTITDKSDKNTNWRQNKSWSNHIFEYRTMKLDHISYQLQNSTENGIKTET